MKRNSCVVYKSTTLNQQHVSKTINFYKNTAHKKQMKLSVLCLAQTESFMVSNPTETATLELGGVLAMTQVSTEPQFSSNADSCLEWRVGSCPDFDQCLRDQLSMERVDVYNGMFSFCCQ